MLLLANGTLSLVDRMLFLPSGRYSKTPKYERLGHPMMCPIYRVCGSLAHRVRCTCVLGLGIGCNLKVNYQCIVTHWVID